MNSAVTSSVSGIDPYCGSAPIPAELWGRWLFEPSLMVGLLAALGAYLFLMRRVGALTGDRHGRTGSERSSSKRDAAWFVAGWGALVIAWVSPLCALSVALFSARSSQHMWVTLIAAPLLAFSRLDRTVTNATCRRAAGVVGLAFTPMMAAALFAVALWAWHVPALYHLTFQSDLAYWGMHLSMLGSAILLWHVILHGEHEQVGSRFFAGFFTLAQMGALGALLTLTPRMLYPVHLLTTQVWSLTPLEDQQLGGLIMWVPGCTAIVVTLLIMVARFLRESAAASAQN